MRTPIGIIGAGPAGLLLAHLLHQAGIDSVVFETRTRADVEQTIRAGMLEDWVVRLLRGMGLGTRLDAEAHFHDGVTLQVGETRQHLDISGLTQGKKVTIYPQHEVLKDLIAARLAQGGPIHFATPVTRIDPAAGTLAFTRDGTEHTLQADYIIATDGFHGPGRRAIPDRREFHKPYPFGWLGILTHAPRSWPELIYARHEDGFALLTTRTEAIQRLYIQVDPTDPIEAWPDARIWEALHTRLATPGWTLTEGPIFQKGIIPLRSFVCETMRHERLFLAGDAAHIVPPTGAKGLNLAAADVLVLSRALDAALNHANPTLLDRYAATALARIWKGERFSWWMTTMLHRDPTESPFEHRIHAADLAYVMQSTAAQTALAENYVGLPFAP